MESVETPPLQNSITEDVKISTVSKEADDSGTIPGELDVCPKSNGVVDISNVEDSTDKIKLDAIDSEVNAVLDSGKDVFQKKDSELVVKNATTSSSTIPENITAEIIVDSTVIDYEQVEEITKENEESIKISEAVTEQENVIDSVVEIDFVEPLIPVTFETEIVVENTGLNDKSNDIKIIEVHSNDLLNELGESIELSEALRSSDTTDNIENNNCAVKQEMFNKEELLDILEGNDIEEPGSKVDTSKIGRTESQISETQLALQQLSRLKRSKKPKFMDRQQKRRKSDKKFARTILDKEVKLKKEDELKKDDELKKEEGLKKGDELKKEDGLKKEHELKKEVNIVNVLVKDWDDEEAGNESEMSKMVEEDENLLKNSVDLDKTQDDATKENSSLVMTSVDSSMNDSQSTNVTKVVDETLPQRRLGRIIKKKVIFDPDNPDTFTKGKTTSKQKEAQPEKDSTLYNKSKNEDSFQRSKSKSPLSKLQWKKPPPKNIKQCRRLTEVDKLLMDEGAVNMIYQLTPEAPKGKKNMKTKAEFIKKIQSSTPDSKEMKFRERKKEYKGEEGEAKKLLSGKQRPSLGSSVKSPSVCEEFEAHCADDSIIYRRHSSSSYSSSCMSPRRLSDVEAGAGNVAHCESQQAVEIDNENITVNNETRLKSEAFMGDNATTPNQIINKDDCLSIKEKLKSKLSLALNKRKRDSHRTDKPSKQKKLAKTDGNDMESNDNATFKFLSVTIDKTLAEICIHKTGAVYNIEVIRELEKALIYIDSKEDISVTLLRSECGSLCSGLDLKPLLVDNIETKASYAFAIAESIRSLLCVLEQHSKLLCIGVGASCSGVGLALVTLSDITLASEQASFMLDSYKAVNSHIRNTPLQPSIAALASQTYFPQSLLNDLVVFGCRLSASDALRNGLINRTVWSDCYLEQVHAIVKDIAGQSTKNILLKKQLLNLNKSGTRDSFRTSLEKERDMLVEYWTSDDGQELIRAAYSTD